MQFKQPRAAAARGARAFMSRCDTRATLQATLLATALLGVAGMAHAQRKTGPDLGTDDSLTWHGITLYGVVDIGLQYETHGAPFSDYHPAGSANIVQKNSRGSVFGATPNNMGQSRVGIQGAEPLLGDWQGVFKLETFFNPQSGDISDASKSMVLNNGRTAATSTTNLNSSVAGEAFESAYAGFSSKTFGTLTFGRQLTLVADGVNKYDPNYGSQAFSLIGMSGGYAGAGDTEDKRIDSALKYTANFAGAIHVGALYKFNGATGSSNTAYQAQVGADLGGASLDAFYSKFNTAISNQPLSVQQVALLPGLGYSPANSLYATVSDNTAFSVMSLYKLDPFKFFLSYEHIRFANPSTPLPVGYSDIGGYTEAFVNNNAYVNDKVYNVYWAGIRYTAVPGLDLAAAYYYVHQNSYGIGATAGCTTSAAATCSGSLEALSLDADYTLSKRFDVYVGAMYSGVHDGLANGYAYHTTNINPTAGVRFKF